MRRALELAERGLETTHPNPRVGCVIARDERVIAEGWHEWPGEAHAEAMALRALDGKAQGATAYVTLEPCSHFGRTPPCANALIEAGLARVVFALQDPNPLVNGRGADLLRAAGIRVESGLMEREAEELNAGFIKRILTGRPFVRLKLAMSLDGRTALANGASKWITSEEARADVQYWRARSSAILTGSGTVLADDPRLDVRIPAARRRHPTRIVLDSSLRTPPEAKLFASPGEVVMFTGLDAQPARSRANTGQIAPTHTMERPSLDHSQGGTQAQPDAAGAELAQRRTSLEARGARIETVARGADSRLDLRAVLERLGQLSVTELFVEAGATLAGALIREGLVDELLIYIAPVLLGPQARPLLALPEITQLDASPRFSIFETKQIGADLRVRLR